MPRGGSQVRVADGAVLQHVPRAQPALRALPLFILIEHVREHALHQAVQPDLITAQKEPVHAIIVIKLHSAKSQ